MKWEFIVAVRHVARGERVKMAALVTRVIGGNNITELHVNLTTACT